MPVPDANILIRAVLSWTCCANTQGRSNSWLLTWTTFQEARGHLPGILAARKIPESPAMETLDLLMRLVPTVEAETYASFEAAARERIEKRDEDDWPVLAAALAPGCPIWTEDPDFFGCGVATWTTDRVELYLLAKAVEREA